MENNVKVMTTDDHSHVMKMTPLDLKKKELAVAKAETEAQEKMQLADTSKLRKTEQARPLGGNGAKE